MDSLLLLLLLFSLFLPIIFRDWEEVAAPFIIDEGDTFKELLAVEGDAENGDGSDLLLPALNLPVLIGIPILAAVDEANNESNLPRIGVLPSDLLPAPEILIPNFFIFFFFNFFFWFFFS